MALLAIIEEDYIVGLVRQHVASTGCCSVAGHMRHSSQTYAEIMHYGWLALPGIFKYMYLERRLGRYAGMNVILLLMDITHESPYKAKAEKGFVQYDVYATQNAWLRWAYDHGYLDTEEYPPFHALRVVAVSKRWWRRLQFWRRK